MSEPSDAPKFQNQPILPENLENLSARDLAQLADSIERAKTTVNKERENRFRHVLAAWGIQFSRLEQILYYGEPDADGVNLDHSYLLYLPDDLAENDAVAWINRTMNVLGEKRKFLGGDVFFHLDQAKFSENDISNVVKIKNYSSSNMTFSGVAPFANQNGVVTGLEGTYIYIQEPNECEPVTSPEQTRSEVDSVLKSE